MASQWKEGWRIEEPLHKEENRESQETYEKMLSVNERQQIKVEIRGSREMWPWRKGRAMLLALEDGGKGPEPRNVNGEAEGGQERDFALESPGGA